MRTLVNKGIVMFAILGTVCGGAAWYIRVGAGQTASFRTAKVTRGDLLVSISATGTVEPEEVIDVGTQVLGRILTFGKDAGGTTVDYGSVVEEGTVLAHIDDSLYLAEVAQAEAQVQSAKAGLEHAEAELEQMKAKLYQADCDWQRAQKLGPSEALSQASYDAYKSAYEIANANVAMGEAAILQARAAIAQAEASLRRAQLNLGYCTIKSPVKGVIIDRRVNIGQTVVASLNAPSLILLAKDLTRMQVWVAVNEADIGKIHPGQPVTFTVDAFPDETFEGKVRKVRLNATMTQNVVTFTVEVITDNSSGKLLPYLTANVQFEISHRTNVFMVPNAALHWLPQNDRVAAEFRAALSSPMGGSGGPGNDRQLSSDPGAQTASESRSQGVLWVQQGDYVRPIKVRVGLSDGTMTEVEGERLTEGLVVVTGEQAVAKRRPQPGDSTETTNPFATKLPPRPGGGRGGPPQ